MVHTIQHRHTYFFQVPMEHLPRQITSWATKKPQKTKQQNLKLKKVK